MILGHERQMGYMREAFRRGKFSHAYFFYGPAHVGKFTLAKSLAKYLHCEKRGDAACDMCRSCVAVENDRHPSVVVLDTAHTLLSKKEARKDIPIEDIRELKRIFSLMPEGDKWRIAIINEAEKLSGEAADAFLKLLEEPGKQTLFFLVSEGRDLVRPTLVSRTHAIHFSFVSDAILRDFLSVHRVDKKDYDTLLAFSAGRPGILMRLLSDHAYCAEEEKFFREVNRLGEFGIVADALLFSDWVHKDPVLRERAISAILRKARERLIASAKNGGAVGNVVRAIHAIDRVAFLLATTNVNPRLAMDVIALEAANIKSATATVV